MEKVRIDKYLWSIRVFKTRTLAAAACDSGKVKWNDNSVKASKTVNVGEKYEIRTPERKWIIEVVDLLDRRKAFSEAVKFYIDLTPEEEKQNNNKLATSFYTGKRQSKVGRPTKKERRNLDDFVGD